MITITMAIITMAIITMAIITISPGPNAHTYAQNLWEAGSWFHRKIWVGDLLSPRSNCLPFLQYLRLQLSTPWPWGIVRSCRGGRAKDKVQTTISTDVMILANIRRLPPATRHTPHATRRPPPAKHCPSYATSLTPPGAWRLPLCKSLDRACRNIHGSI